MDFLFSFPPQPVARKTTRRHLLFDPPDASYGFLISPFGNHIYSYLTDNPEAENEVKQATVGGLYGFLALCVAIASYSWWDLLIMLGLSVGEHELEINTRLGIYKIGSGISGIVGWLAGYLLAKLLSPRRTWASFGGVMIFTSYFKTWFRGGIGISHICHFVTMGDGFVAGLALEYYGPKPRPWAWVRRNAGKFVIAVMLGHWALGYILDSIWPNPEGFLSETDPKNPRSPFYTGDDKISPLGGTFEERKQKYQKSMAEFRAQFTEEVAQAKFRQKNGFEYNFDIEMIPI